MITKFFSRKFLVAVGALVVATVGIFKPGSEEQTGVIVSNITNVMLLAVPSIYVIMEGLKDAKVNNGSS